MPGPTHREPHLPRLGEDLSSQLGFTFVVFPKTTTNLDGSLHPSRPQASQVRAQSYLFEKGQLLHHHRFSIDASHLAQLVKAEHFPNPLIRI